MPELLIATHVFPPKAGGGVQRMVKFAQFLPSHGWTTTVVAPSMDRQAGWSDNSQFQLMDKVKVIRVGAHTKRSLLNRALRKVYPVDSEYPWSAQVTTELSRQKKLDVDAVLTSGPPHSIHRVGQWLAREKNIPWIADFRDHYTLNPEYAPWTGLHRRYDRKFEQQILDQASAVVCNTRTNRRELLAEFGLQYAKKVTTIYNGFDRDDLGEGDQDGWPRYPAERTNYVYLGGLRGGEIDDSFFRMIEQLKNSHAEIAAQIAIHIVGDPSRRTALCDQLVQQQIVHLHPPVPASALGGALRQADACLTWQRDMERYRGTIAGKVFDYLAMEKPVFALGQVGGEVDRLLTRFGLGVCVNPSDTTRATEAFADFHRSLLSSEFQLRQSCRCHLDLYSRRHQSAQLASLLDRARGSR